MGIERIFQRRYLKEGILKARVEPFHIWFNSIMSVEKVDDMEDSSLETCPWCSGNIEKQANSVIISSPDPRSFSYTWHLHSDCAAEWREYVSHLRTLAGRGAFRTLVEEPLRGDVNEMTEWDDAVDQHSHRVELS